MSDDEKSREEQARLNEWRERPFDKQKGYVKMLEEARREGLLGTTPEPPKGLVERLGKFVFGALGSSAFLFFMASGSIGWVYWIWVAFQLGSFWMFLIALFPPTTFFVAGPVGLWSLIFGIPGWITNMFG